MLIYVFVSRKFVLNPAVITDEQQIANIPYVNGSGFTCEILFQGIFHYHETSKVRENYFKKQITYNLYPELMDTSLIV